MYKVCKWDDWWCHTLNPILHYLSKQSYLGQFAAQIIETWQGNSSIENSPKDIKHFVAMATHSFPVPTHLISICKWFSETFLIQIGWDTFFHHIWSNLGWVYDVITRLICIFKKLEYLWNKKRHLKIVNSIFLLMQATCSGTLKETTLIT